MALDPKNPTAKALADAVATAAEKLGPLATVTLLDGHMQAIRRMADSNEYPRTLYGKEGKTATVQSKAEEDDLGKGWSRTPADEHRAMVPSGAVATTQEMLAAELAVRRQQASLDPANSAAASAATATGTGLVTITTDTTSAKGA